MGNLADDTTVVGGGGTWTAELNEDWAIWGPNGGYLAAVAVRAAGEHSSQPRPASLVCHYLGVASFAPVELTTETLRGAKRAESTRVRMTQAGQPILEALVWSVADDLSGLTHDLDAAPEVPHPDELTEVRDLLPEGTAAPHRFFENFDEKPVSWIPEQDWERRDAGEPRHQCWYRFRHQPTFDEPYVDAGRLAVLVDTFMWPAASRAYAAGELHHIAPSLDLQVSFHRLAHDTDWLLVDAVSETAGEGLVAGRASVWAPDGRLVASGSQQMLCRPAPG